MLSPGPYKTPLQFYYTKYCYSETVYYLWNVTNFLLQIYSNILCLYYSIYNSCSKTLHTTVKL